MTLAKSGGGGDHGRPSSKIFYWYVGGKSGDGGDHGFTSLKIFYWYDARKKWRRR